MKRSIKDAAKRGHDSECKMLAKEIVRARKVQTRLHTSKAHMNSVVMQMENQYGETACTRAASTLSPTARARPSHSQPTACPPSAHG